jgi:hypothetical protein
MGKEVEKYYKRNEIMKKIHDNVTKKGGGECDKGRIKEEKER